MAVLLFFFSPNNLNFFSLDRTGVSSHLFQMYFHRYLFSSVLMIVGSSVLFTCGKIMVFVCLVDFKLNR